MDYRTILELLAAYEQQHDVAEYRLCGWAVWPLVRNSLAGMVLEGCGGSAPATRRSLPGLGRLQRAASLAWSLAKPRLIDRAQGESSTARAADVVIITPADRRQQVGGVFWSTIADPLAELLRESGLSCMIWERGGGIGPRYARSAWIDGPLAWQALHERRREPLSLDRPPAWFADVARAFEPLLKRRLNWSRFQYPVEQITLMSRVFERWLEAVGPRVLFIDSWPGWTSMGAVLAASRMELPVVEVQHCRQGGKHHCYTHWTVAPPEGYEVIPKLFWVWGERDREALEQGNALPATALVGGNLWINRWLDDKSPDPEADQVISRRLTGASRSVLVTLPYALADVETMLAALEHVVRRSPYFWIWMFRFHRSMPGRQRTDLLERLGAWDHPGCDTREANRLPLYALLRRVDIHVTDSSTTALEAAAFGVPTVLTHEYGRWVFDEFVSQGVMRCETQSDCIFAAIEDSAWFSPHACREMAQRVFAPPHQTQQSIRRIASAARDGTWPAPATPSSLKSDRAAVQP